MKVYRAHQLMMRSLSKVIPFPRPKLLTGAGCVSELADHIKQKGLKRVLIVTDSVLMGLKLLDTLTASFDKHNIKYTIFDEVQPNPTIKNVEDGRKVYLKNRCNGIVAFGGGSPMDCAKMIGARVRNPYMSVQKMRGLFRVFIPIPPFYCVPTTAGTGSETTIVAVISNPETHEKLVITDFKLVPKVAVLDPELMVGLPKHITSTTGMDALTHAIEAYIGHNGTKFTNGNAEEATKLIFENLEKVYHDGSDLEARSNMALASFYAGLAFTKAYVGYVHAIAHNMGGLYGVPHGLANAIILPHVLEFSAEAAESKLASLAIAGGIGKSTESERELSHRFIAKVKAMNENMSMPTTIKELKESDIPLIAKRALAEAHPDYPVPTFMCQSECEDLIRKLLP